MGSAAVPAQALIGRCTLIDWSSPTATQTANIEDPPYDTNGSGSPATGMMPSVIPMFSKAWKANQAMIPAATIVPYSSLVSRAIRQARHRTTPSSTRIRPAAEEAEFLARDGEDEVGLLLGDELAGGLGAVEEARSGESAGADRDACLVGVVADARRVERGVGEGGEAGDLVLVEQAELPDRDRAGHARAEQSGDPAVGGAGGEEHAEHDDDHDHHGAEVRHSHDDGHRDGRQAEGLGDGPVVGVELVAACRRARRAASP